MAESLPVFDHRNIGGARTVYMMTRFAPTERGYRTGLGTGITTENQRDPEEVKSQSYDMPHGSHVHRPIFKPVLPLLNKS